ncbi:putative WD repeat-containing protein [Wickerhamomyces ciferrii]|uniref:Polyadenylation factor subunit 2 n=1 Tax=Wickerhamomyces ciferrii (strain ATCC 14091 / BCRC 22168 / CBS 111 / JCM 3599 / NBRC 0793 / NRRL Y-1031 F-60-10) TaxID=1206466 RepID=K0KMY8_WICCF|nr:putative WD repeat-containing protein [Wickerhamomyces ciferrii]CCH42724.1 putative WD repeat-containing protein [Wickerhamomyces ciferrii]
MERTPYYTQSLETQLASQQKRSTAHRRIIDHGAPYGRWSIYKKLGHKRQLRGEIRPEASYTVDLLPSVAYSARENVIDTPTKFVHLSSNKAKHAIHSIKWTPEGRRLLVASHSGEFTLWNGMTFNFETIMQAHDTAVLCLNYSHNDDWLLSGDQDGVLKFWQSNFNNVNIINAHDDAIRDVVFAPGDGKFVTASDDSSLKIWNFSNGQEERVLKGHNWDVKCADWHSSLGLIVSGSKDNLIKLWDPRSGTPVTTLHGFKHTITKTKFQPFTDSYLLSSISRDRSMRIFDLRTMKDVFIYRSEVDLSSLAWNPIHRNMITTGGYDGSMNHYNLTDTTPELSQLETIKPYHTIPYAHEKAIHSLEYHPLGHILTSAGADRSARFWCRGRPNDPNAFNDPPYSNDKVGAWYFAINNSVNAVVPANENVGNKSQQQQQNNRDDYRYNLPGLDNGNDFGYTSRSGRGERNGGGDRGGYNLPGLGY